MNVLNTLFVNYLFFRSAIYCCLFCSLVVSLFNLVTLHFKFNKANLTSLEKNFFTTRLFSCLGIFAMLLQHDLLQCEVCNR